MRHYGLIGKTLKHSFSENYFKKKFVSENITDCDYKNFELQSIHEIVDIIKADPHLRGFNITIPYKEEIVPFLHYRNEIVQETGACNCIRIDEERNLYGYNTDVLGFKLSLEKYLLPHHDKALILGTGGAAKAVEYVLCKLNINFKNVSRRKVDNGLLYEELSAELLESYTLIINTTPLGMYPNIESKPPIPYQYISHKHLLFDLIYNPERTQFLLEGVKQGASVVNGSKMLIIQAEESWRIWNA